MHLSFYSSAIGIGSGDNPRINSKCLSNFPHASSACIPYTKAPILQFGSVFRSQEVLPNMIAMPMPISNGLHCFVHWAYSDKVSPSVCSELSSATSAIKERRLAKFASHGLVFNDGDTDKTWDELIPQVLWRGTNFGFLAFLNRLRMPNPRYDVPYDQLDKVEGEMEQRKAATVALRGAYDNLFPRWQGLVLTAEAELDAAERNDGTLPWANMKFAPGKRIEMFQRLQEYGIPLNGGVMNPDKEAEYRYQIDIGGGGGTTWSGTTQKLAMPGLLFHHVTATKDYIHDRMKPYIHYVPVKSDLSDLKEKYDWAEANPEAAKMIANQGTQLMRHIGTIEGFGEVFEEHFVEPLHRVMEAYQPVSATHDGLSWRDIIKSTEDISSIKVETTCAGNDPGKGACENVSDII